LVLAQGDLIFDGAPEKAADNDVLREKAGLDAPEIDLERVLSEQYGMSKKDPSFEKLMRFFGGEGDAS
jgi:hypothetical protein